MPANLSPEYKAAEAAFRRTHDAKGRLECLREMLRTIPKHKGTEHLQADIKTRIKQLTDELSGPRKGAARGGPPTVIRPEGAAQIALIGPPNVGKSTLHARLTGSSAQSGPYPFTTQFPQPGMLAYEDIHFQLIDLPPVTPEHPVPWLVNALQPADACLLIVDLGEPSCVDQVLALYRILAEKRITLVGEDNEPAEQDPGDPFALRLPTLMLANKADRLRDVSEELRVFQELTRRSYATLVTSAETGAGLDQIAPALFRRLAIVRVYTKAPGRPPDKDRPFTVRRGHSVADVATLVHKEIAGSLKYARLWREGESEGLQIGRDHHVADGDVLELHT